MYASPFQPRRAAATAGLYRQVGVQTGVESATPHRLVAMLYDGLIEALARARGALQTGQIEIKCRAMNQAIRIVEEGLLPSLDAKAGGEVATNLRDLYRYISLRLTQANLKNDESIIVECVNLIEPVRQAWAAIGAQAAAHQAEKVPA
ncbi:MAG: flagellar export chaperone FliS [Aquabacterium sp.]|nr:flagellar export chaperone FliS [Aquabacterium sp.]